MSDPLNMPTFERGDSSPDRGARRKSKATPERIAGICKLIASGLSPRRAAEKLRIHHSTLANWRERDSDLSREVANAEAQFIERQIGTIETAANKGSWQAAAWLLERRYPTEFSQPQIQIQNNLSMKVEHEPLDEVLLRLQTSPAAMKAFMGFESASPGSDSPE